jgi:hypothetical protein
VAGVGTPTPVNSRGLPYALATAAQASAEYDLARDSRGLSTDPGHGPRVSRRRGVADCLFPQLRGPGVKKMAGKTSKKSAKVAKKAAAKRAGAKPALLAGGNPQIAKADGDAPVEAYIAAMPGWKRDVGRRLDALIVRTVPARARQSNGPRPSMASRARAGSSASIASRSTSRWLSSAARRCVLSRPASPRARTRATSTFMRTTSSTKLNSPLG